MTKRYEEPVFSLPPGAPLIVKVLVTVVGWFAMLLVVGWIMGTVILAFA